MHNDAKPMQCHGRGRVAGVLWTMDGREAGHTGDNAEGCDSEVAVKREGSQIPLPINTMQEPVHPKAVSNDFVNLSK